MAMHKTLVLFMLCCSAILQAQVLTPPVRMLALGDSYTIGQSVPPQERWPIQLRDSLVERGVAWDTVEIIAVTGWRTDNLAAAMNARQLDSNYNFVSLLIGVNNQYQNRDTATYAAEFEGLLQAAIGLAMGNKEQVVVLSIPDYAYTNFGQQTNPTYISGQIDIFNAINRRITRQYAVPYCDITPISREGVARPALVAGDGLHPSGLQYQEWVSLLLDSLTIQQPTVSKTLYKPNDRLVYPNPVQDELQLNVSANSIVSIFSTQGRLMHRQYGTASIDLAKWPAGNYWLLVEDNGIRWQQMIVKL